MRLDDSMLYLCVETEQAGSADTSEFCSAAIAGGVDIISLDCSSQSRTLEENAVEIAEICRSNDALFIVGDNAELAARLGADGVHLTPIESSIGIARAVTGMQSLVGMSTRSVDEAFLALEVGADYLIHLKGTACRDDFAAVAGGGAAPMFAGGIGGKDEAERIVESGVYRLCVSSEIFKGDGFEEAAELSRLLGRSI